MKRFIIKSCVAVTMAVGFVGAASAAEVFAEPSTAKGGMQGYQLTAFVGPGQDGLSFTMELPAGVEKVSLSACGVNGAGAVAKCYYEPTTRKLAVALLRLDGKALEGGEYDLGQVIFSNTSRAKLQPVEVQSVKTASRRGASGETVSTGVRSTNAER